jgi:mandelate racemase
MRIGGVPGWLRAAPIAASMGIEVSTHLYPEVAAHLMGITENAHWLAWQDCAYPMLAEPFELAAGRFAVPPKPGCEIEWDESAIKHFANDV